MAGETAAWTVVCARQAGGSDEAAHQHAGSFPLINIQRWKVVKP